MSVDQFRTAEVLSPTDERQALSEEMRQHLATIEPFTTGFQFEVRGGNENLRTHNPNDPNDRAVQRRTQEGEIFTVLEALPNRGAYEYVLVEDVSGAVYALCINDTLGHRSLYENQIEPETEEIIEIASIDPSQMSIPLAKPEAEILPEEALGVELLALENPAAPADQYNPELMSSDGILTAAVGPLRIESCIPWGINEATIILSAENRHNGSAPTGIPLHIIRENGTFVFNDEALNSSDRVRVAAGDQLTWSEPEAPDTTNLEVETHDSIIATVIQEKTSWETRDLVPPSLQNQAVCAAFVQNYLNSTLGMDFMQNSGIIRPGEPTPDAWEMVHRLQETGHGQIAADLSHFFEIDSANQTIVLNDTSDTYQRALQDFVTAAGEVGSEFGIIGFHYKRTSTNPRILASETSTLNSHVAVNLGIGTRNLETVSEGGTHVADYIISQTQDRLGLSYDNSWEQNRDYLALLENVQVLTTAGTTITLHYDTEQQDFIDSAGEIYVLQPEDEVTYQDIQLAHFYHNSDRPNNEIARVDGLVEILLQGNFELVNLTQIQGIDDRISGRLTAEASPNFIIDNILWEGPTPVTREALISFYQTQYEAAITNGHLPEGTDVNAYAERATTYVFNFTHSALLNLAGGGDLPDGTRLPLLNWEAKPGNATPTVIENPEDVVASRPRIFDRLARTGQAAWQWARSWFV